MMAAQDLRIATQNLTCPVCYKIFKNPKYLPCYHSYCEACLENMTKENFEIACPECRKTAIVPAGGVKELANNFFINRLVDQLILQHKVENEVEVKCDKCEEPDPVVTFCLGCSIFLCHICNEAHGRDKTTREHTKISLPELRASKGIPVRAKPKPQICKEHGNELLYYCETCQELVCLYCTVKSHVGHTHDTTKQMAKKHKSELKGFEVSLDEMTKDLLKIHDEVNKVRNKILKQKEEVKRKIDQYYDDLAKKLMRQKEQLKQQVDKIESQEEKVVIQQLQEVETVQEKVVNMKSLHDAAMDSSDQEFLSAKKQIVDRMQKLTGIYESMNTQPLETAIVKFSPQPEAFPKFGSIHVRANPEATEIVDLPSNIIIGKKVECTIITKYVSGSQQFQGGDRVAVTLQSSKGSVTPANVTDNSDGSHGVSFVVQQIGEHRFSISINGQDLHKECKKLMARINYREIEKTRYTINDGGNLGEPWGIAFRSDDTWAVSDYLKHHVYTFDADDQVIAKFGTKGCNNGQFRNPRGVTFDDNHLYVVDNGNHRVQKFDVNGNYLSQFGTKGAGEGNLNDPRGITAHKGMVYITEQGNKRVSIFSNDGQFSHIIGRGHLSNPYDVVVNVNDIIFVADYNHHCVYSFTMTGVNVGKFGAQGSEHGQLSNPVSLATDPCGFLVITENGNHRVSVFTDNGNLVHCFGSKGNGDGQFSNPRGVALKSNGSIYVNDRNNNKVQIFSHLE